MRRHALSMPSSPIRRSSSTRRPNFSPSSFCLSGLGLHADLDIGVVHKAPGKSLPPNTAHGNAPASGHRHDGNVAVDVDLNVPFRQLNGFPSRIGRDDGRDFVGSLSTPGDIFIGVLEFRYPLDSDLKSAIVAKVTKKSVVGCHLESSQNVVVEFYDHSVAVHVTLGQQRAFDGRDAPGQPLCVVRTPRATTAHVVIQPSQVGQDCEIVGRAHSTSAFREPRQ